MSNILRSEIIIFSTLLIMAIIFIVRKRKMTVRYSLVWIAFSLIMLVGALFPNILLKISTILGFEVVSNMVFFLIIIMLIIISISLTIIVSNQTEKIKLIIQEISILKKESKK